MGDAERAAPQPPAPPQEAESARNQGRLRRWRMNADAGQGGAWRPYLTADEVKPIRRCCATPTGSRNSAIAAVRSLPRRPGALYMQQLLDLEPTVALLF
jgi:hypothetical protein